MSSAPYWNTLRAKLRAAIIIALGLASAEAATAQTLQVQLQAGGGPPVTVQDNGPGDSSPELGVVTYVGPVGSFTLNVVTGLSKPVLGTPTHATIDLKVLSVQGAATDTITIKLTDINFPGPINGTALFTSSVGGTTDSPATTKIQAFLDSANVPFGISGPTVCTPGLQGASGAAFDSTVSANCDLNGPFSITTVAEARLGPGQQFGFDHEVGVDVPVCGAIGDFVWHDLNHNGIQDAGEPGINGVTLWLKDGATTLATTVTGPHPMGGSAGYYQFNNVCSGDYQVEVDATTVPAGFTPTAKDVGPDSTDNDSSGLPVPVTLANDGDSDQTIDFGFESPCTGMIGDFVWNDLNQNGVQDAGEPGIPGVTVRLVEGNQTTVTGPNGFYQFTGLCAGSYTVEVLTPPAGMTPTTPNVGDVSTDSNGSPTGTTLTADDSVDLTLDFGYYTPCTGGIGNFVWKDLNRDGVQDAGEPGIQGVQIFLKDASNVVIASTFTDMNGFYQFSGLCGADYTVAVDSTSLPPGLTASPTGAATPALDSNPNPTTITLPNNTVDDTIDFGYMPPCDGSIGNFVWNDLNFNGLQDAGEPGIGGVVLELRRQSDNSLIGLATSDANGFYQFTGLCRGDYKVVAIPPSGFPYVPTTSLIGSDTAIDSNANPTLVTLPTDFSSDQTNDFGYVQPAALGDFVWKDLDADGIQDGGEPGIPGVGVTLLKCDGSMVSVTTTDASGLYLFTGLAPGCYKVQFGTPAGFTPSPANVGGDATDSDSVGGVTGNYTLVAGETNLTVDAGFYKLASLGDFVWKDLNSNGIQDAGEPGIAGVLETLLRCDNTPTGATTTTNASGFYLFANLVPGCYKVQFGTPVGLLPTTADVGNDALDSDAVAGVSGNYTLISGETNLTVDAGFVAPPPPPCVPTTFTFTGNTATSGASGNIRTFTVNGVSVKASAFSRIDSTGVWNTAYLGLYGPGLGVTDGSEGDGSNNRHKVDNIGGRDNYILFEFSQPVVVNQAFLDAVGADSDATVWIGTKTDPYNNHLTLSDVLLAGLTSEISLTTSTAARWAAFNGSGQQGNVLIIAAQADDTTPEDAFKVSKLGLVCTGTPTCVETTFAFTGNTATSGAAGNIRTFSSSGISVKASAFSRIDSTGTWNTAYLGLYGPGLGVTDGSEGDGSNDRHKVDNMGGRDNYILFEFSQPVVVNQAFLDAVGADSDMTVWYGTKTDPYNNHLTLSDAQLSSLTSEVNTTTSTLARWAGFNASGVSANVIIIAAQADDTTPEDAFKVSKLSVVCASTPPPPPPCVSTTFGFVGNTATYGTAGNIRTFTSDGVSVKASAFSRRDDTGGWNTAFLGLYSHGLGVTDTSEGTGANNTHVVDNGGGRDNYVLFEFSQGVTITQAYLDYIVGDSDITVWIGTKADPYNNHLALSDALLSSLTKEENAGGSSARWAAFNGTAMTGNVLIIAAKTTSDTNDGFKLSKIGISCK